MDIIICCVPLGKGPQALPNADLRGEAVIPLQHGGIRVGHRHISGLHSHQFPVAHKVIVRRQYPRPDQLLLEGAHVGQQVLRLSAADVVHRIGRQEQAVLSVALVRRPLHDPYTPSTMSSVLNGTFLFPP